MLTSVISGSRNVRQYAELEGARALVTGIDAETGVDIARGFAEVGCRLVLQIEPDDTDDAAEKAAALLRILANTATEVRATEQPLGDAETAVRFAQGAAQAFGGLDAVVNVIIPKTGAITSTSTVDEIEAAVSDTLRTACLVTRIAANRMSLTWTEGLILNVVLAPAPRTKADAAFTSILGQALAAMTRAEAAKWAQHGIRINAVGPRAGGIDADATRSGLVGEADITALALHLASKRGHSLSGHIFDAEGIASRRC